MYTLPLFMLFRLMELNISHEGFRLRKLKMENSKFKIQNPDFSIQNFKINFQNAIFKIEQSELKIQI